MRAWILLGLTAALSGCATHGVHVGRGPDPLHNWASVRALEPGTSIRAEVGYNSFWEGSLVEVTDSTLAIRMTSSMTLVPLVIARDRISSIAADLPKRRAGIITTQVLGLVGGLAGYAGLAKHNAKLADTSGQLAAGSAMALVWTALSTETEFRVIYVRP